MDNYRPISVLPTISKGLERVVHRQLMNYLSEQKLLSEHQYDFRPKMSTELASFKLIDDVRSEVDKENYVGAMFIALTKAFDTDNHSQLLNELPQYGVHGKELDWLKDYLFQRMVRVAYNGSLSQVSYSFPGVPQGSILGPLLFVIAFNDTTNVIREPSVIMYADDVVLYVAADGIRTVNLKLSKDTESIADWMDGMNLLSISKRVKLKRYRLERRNV